MNPAYTKDPDETLDYWIDWSKWTKWPEWEPTDSIVSSTWVVPVGLVKNSDDTTGAKTLVWLSGGTAGKDYEVVNRITTAAGRISEQAITIKVRSS